MDQLPGWATYIDTIVFSIINNEFFCSICFHPRKINILCFILYYSIDKYGRMRLYIHVWVEERDPACWMTNKLYFQMK